MFKDRYLSDFSTLNAQINKVYYVVIIRKTVLVINYMYMHKYNFYN